MYWCIEYCCNSSIIPLFQKAYRDWLCTQHIPVFSRNSPPSRIPPCGDFCSGVEHKCPFLRPLTETTYAGEPSFICKGKSGHAVRPRCHQEFKSLDSVLNSNLWNESVWLWAQNSDLRLSIALSKVGDGGTRVYRPFANLSNTGTFSCTLLWSFTLEVWALWVNFRCKHFTWSSSDIQVKL